MIKFLVMDVDGTMTDGKIYIGEGGELFKAFDIKDGYGIKDIIPGYDIVPIIITARKSRILENRCQELNIKELHQGIRAKFDKLVEIIIRYNKTNGTNFGLSDCAYIGDDILDLKCMIPIKEAGGIVGCPADAVQEIKAIADYRCTNKAGEGALREFVEWLIQPCVSKAEIEERVNAALAYLMKLEIKDIGVKHKVNENFFYYVQSDASKPPTDCKLKSHRQYVDIHILVSGKEIMDFVDVSRLTVKEAYSAEKDIIFWNIPDRMVRTTLRAGDYVILYPENAYRDIVCDEDNVVMIVGKVKLCTTRKTL